MALLVKPSCSTTIYNLITSNEKNMPRTKMINPDEIEVFSAQPFDEPEREETAQEKKTNAFEESLNTTGDEGTISVHRQDNGGKEAMVFIKSCPADQYTLESLLTYIQTNHPSGQYRIMLRVNGRIKGNQLYTIESPVGVHDTTAGATGDVATMAQLIREMNTRQMPAPESEAQQIQKMLMYKELFAQPVQPASDPMAMMTAMIGAMGMMQKMVSDNQKPKDEEDGAMGRSMEMLGTLVGTVMTTKANAPAVQATPQNQPQPTQEEQEEIDMFNRLKAGVTQLVSGAKKKADPAIYAEMIVDNVAPHTIETFFNNADGLAQLIKQFPVIDDHKQWFVDVIEHVKAIQGDASSKFYSEYQEEGAEILEGEIKEDENET